MTERERENSEHDGCAGEIQWVRPTAEAFHFLVDSKNKHLVFSMVGAASGTMSIEEDTRQLWLTEVLIQREQAERQVKRVRIETEIAATKIFGAFRHGELSCDECATMMRIIGVAWISFYVPRGLRWP